MINESLNFLTDEVNKYLSLKLSATTDPRLVLGNVSRAFDTDTSGTDSLLNKAILSLVNVEEDRISRSQENFVRTDAGITYKSPPVYLNLYVLFSVNLKDYSEALKWLGYIIQFFQYQNVFTPLTNPSLDPRIQKLVVDMFTLNFEQVNNLWSTLGGKYLPSALFKVRQITIDEDATEAMSGFIKEIDINDRSIPPVS
ncbi:DUF4255 domain-containing protein [Chitinophagaceae bacterium MMS25-I14]